MKQVNLLCEIKQLNTSIGKKLFQIQENKQIQNHPSPLQMEILEVIQNSEKKEVFPKDIQNELNVSKAAISDALNKMEKKEYIKKIPWKKDGRKTQIILLENGKKNYKKLKDNLDNINEEISNCLDKKELTEFIRMIHKIKNNIEKR